MYNEATEKSPCRLTFIDKIAYEIHKHAWPLDRYGCVIALAVLYDGFSYLPSSQIGFDIKNKLTFIKIDFAYLFINWKKAFFFLSNGHFICEFHMTCESNLVNVWKCTKMIESTQTPQWKSFNLKHDKNVCFFAHSKRQYVP